MDVPAIVKTGLPLYALHRYLQFESGGMLFYGMREFGNSVVLGMFIKRWVKDRISRMLRNTKEYRSSECERVFVIWKWTFPLIGGWWSSTGLQLDRKCGKKYEEKRVSLELPVQENCVLRDSRLFFMNDRKGEFCEGKFLEETNEMDGIGDEGTGGVRKGRNSGTRGGRRGEDGYGLVFLLVDHKMGSDGAKQVVKGATIRPQFTVPSHILCGIELTYFESNTSIQSLCWSGRDGVDEKKDEVDNMRVEHGRDVTALFDMDMLVVVFTRLARGSH
ncbi:unnamed protein product [Angiostrongylus costaricensis]|uniref:DUF4283 domain-containing protein n=1 Tax=Angiostrongylus costaricensis TaxID=334426 RepID=A0A158PLG4_ANGCS|nr:unnamed protein product [Angiostrongylus costaricensis]